MHPKIFYQPKNEIEKNSYQYFTNYIQKLMYKVHLKSRMKCNNQFSGMKCKCSAAQWLRNTDHWQHINFLNMIFNKAHIKL